jgi:SprT protein
MQRAPVIPTKRILTPELQKKIEARVRECLDIAQKVYPKHAKKFDKLPTILYNIKNTVGGLAYTGGDMDYTIRLNLIFCFENEAEFIKQTVGHEAAHLICDRVFGTFKEVDGKRVKIRPHGTEWKEVMKHLGLVPHRTHVYDTTSLDLQPKKRRKRGATITVKEIAAMIKRLQNGFHRLPDSGKEAFMYWMETDGKNAVSK